MCSAFRQLPSVALIQQHPEMLRPFASVVVERLRTAMSGPARPSLPATIALIDIGGGDTRRVAAALADEIHDLSVRVIESDEAPAEAERAAWLLEIENRTELALLITDPEPTAWTRRCLRHADRALLVADASTAGRLSPVESDPEIADRLSEITTHLVVTHNGTPRASRWLPNRTPTTWTNLRLDDLDQVRRVTREMTGRANIAVLSGGGARGFAHFGVVRALRDHGIPIDGIMGASAGSVVGALIARLGDPVEAQRQMFDWFSGTSWRRDLTPPTLALTTGRIMTEGLQELGADALIEDLPIEFSCVSCDLVTGKPVVHDRGPVWQAIRASGSVPGLFPPVRVGEQLLVDGGLVANLPTELARERHPNANLIAVDVGDPAGIDTSGVDGSGIANGWSRLRPGDRGRHPDAPHDAADRARPPRHQRCRRRRDRTRRAGVRPHRTHRRRNHRPTRLRSGCSRRRRPPIPPQHLSRADLSCPPGQRGIIIRPAETGSGASSARRDEPSLPLGNER